jgi:hypothetical protein
LLTLCARDWRKLEAAETPSSEYGAPSQSLQPTDDRRDNSRAGRNRQCNRVRKIFSVVHTML